MRLLLFVHGEMRNRKKERGQKVIPLRGTGKLGLACQ